MGMIGSERAGDRVIGNYGMKREFSLTISSLNILAIGMSCHGLVQNERGGGMGRSLRAHLLNASRGTKRVALGKNQVRWVFHDFGHYHELS